MDKFNQYNSSRAILQKNNNNTAVVTLSIKEDTLKEAKTRTTVYSGVLIPFKQSPFTVCSLQADIANL